MSLLKALCLSGGAVALCCVLFAISATARADNFASSETLKRSDMTEAVDLSQFSNTFPYTWNDLRKILFYAYAAFCFDNLKDWSCFWCLSQNVTGQYPQVNVTVPAVQVDVLLESDGLYGTYGYTGASNESIIIAFRGSASFQNWIHDLEFWMTSYPGIPGAEVHHGFLDSYLAIRDSLRSSIKKLRAQNPNFPILITGHSLGAAQAVLAAVDLALFGFKNIHLLNFGQPRVGNAAFAAATAKLVTDHYRVVNMADIVPHYPFTEFFYTHHPQEVWFKHNGLSWTLCSPTNGEDPNCADSLEPWQWDPADHLLYLDIFQGVQSGHGCGSPPPL